MLAKIVNPFLIPVKAFDPLDSSTNSISFGMEIIIVASLLTHRENHCQDCLPTSVEKSTAGKSHVGARNVLLGRGDEESLYGRDSRFPSDACEGE